MLHSSEPSLIQHNPTKEIPTGIPMNNTSGTRDASTSTVPKSKQMMLLTSAPSMQKENQTSSGVGANIFHNELNKPSLQDEQRFQASRYYIFSFHLYKLLLYCNLCVQHYIKK